MVKPIGHWICLDVRTDLVQETFMSEGVLQAQRRSQGSGKERRLHGMHQDPLTSDRSFSSALAIDTPCDVGGGGVAPIVQSALGLACFSGSDGFRIETSQHSGDYISG